MRPKPLYAVAVCLFILGVAGIAIGGDQGHEEPTNVAASCLVNSATVSWSAVNDNHLSGYDVYKKTSSETQYTRANPSLVTGTVYVVTGLSSGTTYNFAVMAMFNDGHTSALSTPSTCTTN